MAMPPDYLPKALEGLARLAKNGLSYPIPQYGIQSDARAGLGFSYKDVKQAVLPEPAPERFRGCDPAIRPVSPDAGQRRAGGEIRRALGAATGPAADIDGTGAPSAGAGSHSPVWLSRRPSAVQSHFAAESLSISDTDSPLSPPTRPACRPCHLTLGYCWRTYSDVLQPPSGIGF